MALNTIATKAINDSIRENRIVTLPYEVTAHDYVPVVDALTGEADDWVESSGVLEFWGADEDGDEWRVHVVQPRSV